ncbi:hypothetical protein M427DRAFT_341068 [Gonapodya prolifera JEL478]|uniref:Uncharacterized protein n=1 Tax=Gonapodya prolifera (strain JEL478) TaxID=1344416 RepID=A0A139AC81_GONPJ|nr:hypothetical protein M427DRAFT_341068 [Gonapodya prolifera JEL478]|eukprot:KXS14380.1 hypothetical protein M427DRAFT_341068 [Gonapodya prolifera JEL478]
MLELLSKVADTPKHLPSYPKEATDQHKRLRRPIAPAFSVKYLANVEPQMLQVYSSLERKILATPKDAQGYVKVDMFESLHILSGLR